MIELQDVHKTYDTGTKALNGISMKIDDGEFVFLVGPSGSGKSTIIKILTAELRPTSGSALVNGFAVEKLRGRAVPYLRRTLGVIFQDFRLISDKSVYENVAFAMRVIGAPEKEIQKRVPYVLELVGLETKGRRLPNELSGGEQQRVAIARALVNNPSVIIADEPTGNLDPARSLEIMMLLEQINALGTTVLVVTHERELVNRFTKRVVAISEGRIISDGMDGYFSMKKNNIGYLLREGFRGVFLHSFMSFAAICVTVACLIIMGSFCLILYNTSAMVKELEQENEMLVYIDESYSEAKAKSVGSQINLITNVRSATFVSREQALQDFVDEQNDANLFDGLDPDTLRDRYVVTVEDNSLLQQTYDKLTQIEGVAEVKAHFEIAQGFQTVQNVLNIASLVIVTVLFVVSLFIISNTVKLAMYSRSEEIAIMKMVGATNAFIRLPFVVEGFIIGIIAAAAAFFLEWGLYDFVLTKIQQLDTLKLFVLTPFTDVIEIVAIAYALTGFLVGVFGSLLSIRKFLKE